MVERAPQRPSWPVQPDFVERVCAHVATSGQPETASGLYHGPISKDEPFRIIREVSIPRGKRADGKMAPCPMCQPNKFLEGRLVYFTQLEAVALIGHCCAGRETRSAAEREFREREARNRWQDSLLDALPSLSIIMDEVRDLEARVAATQQVFDQFRRSGASFQRTLRQAVKGTGNLVVTQVLGPRMEGGPTGLRTAGSTVETRDVVFGRLSGVSAVAPRCSVADDLLAVAASLGSFPAITSDDACLAFITGLDDEALAAAAGNVTDARKKLALVRAALKDMEAFFTIANAERITAWGSHRDAPVRMRAGHRPSKLEGHVEFVIVDGQGRRVGILIPSVFWESGRAPATEVDR